MDEDRPGSLRDELAREIERALAVDPGPALKAQVRARIDRERARGWWLPRRVAIAAGAGVLALSVVAMLVVRAPERVPPSSSGASAAVAVAPAPAGSPQPPAVDRARADQKSVHESEVTLASRVARPRPILPPAVEPEALEPSRLAATIQDSQIDGPAIDLIQLSVAPLEPLREIAIQAIAIEPLSRLELLEGDR